MRRVISTILPCLRTLGSLAVFALIIATTLLIFEITNPGPRGRNHRNSRFKLLPLDLPTPSSSDSPNLNDIQATNPHQPIVTLPSGIRGTLPPPLPDAAIHPIHQLIVSAEAEFDALVARQSKTLEEAVREYRRRYDGLPPPPHFDKWFAFAKERGVVLVDEFDTIHDLLAPFWGLRPGTVRKRAREAISSNLENQILGIMIRNGRVVEATEVEEGREWMREAIVEMMQGFVRWLPDCELGFNLMDEPRVVVLGEEMEGLVRTGRERMRRAGRRVANGGVRNEFTRPADGEKEDDGGLLGIGTTRAVDAEEGFGEVVEGRTSMFITASRRNVWPDSRMACPPSSPARIVEEEVDGYDDVATYAVGPLGGFVRNWTAMSDVCLSPSVRERHGFFQSPNAYSVVKHLAPVFSQSKVSTYADILYPSPWYWVGMVEYDEEEDCEWEEKLDSLYWRGSTTGGYAKGEGWRRHHRQRLVMRLNSKTEEVLILSPPGSGSSTATSSLSSSSQTTSTPAGATKVKEEEWTPQPLPLSRLSHIFNLSFTHIGQCSPSACSSQSALLPLSPYVPQSAAYRHKHVLDADGNAFSGRFYALLRSRSLVYKWAVFREWHDDGWLRPWVHFVPMSLAGGEWVEVVRYFALGGGSGGGGGGGGGGGSGDGERNEKEKKKADGRRGKREWFPYTFSSTNKEEKAKDPASSPLGGPKVAERLANQGREWANKALRREDMEVWFFRLLLE
ncbi:hypothetical protein VTJ04DRAFT_283 [Mycothermus thermophilus]|uniref:uncharacterized protein n=1 Tax=Humicola insolens TaxID=85995 RepID=UPI0037440DF9